MTKEERNEKIKFCKENEIYFYEISSVGWEELSDEQLDKEVEWFDYLWSK